MACHDRAVEPPHLRCRCAARCVHPFQSVRPAARAARPRGDGDDLFSDRAARLSQGVTTTMALLARLRRLLPYALIFGLLAGVYALPSDTSLAEVRKATILRACMPPTYPPLVTGDPAA